MAKAAKDAGLSVSGTVKEMMELQQTGDLISSKVLPHFARRMSEAAQANGGLEAALNSNRVAMNRFMFAAQEAADKFFKSGFAEGLTEFFEASSGFIVDNGDLWESLGKIIGSVLKGVASIIKTLSPVIESFGAILKSVTDLLGEFSGIAAAAFMPLTYTILPAAIKGVGGLTSAFKGLFAVLRRILMPAILLIGALEEISEFFNPTGKKTLIGMNVDDFGKLSTKKKELQDRALDAGYNGYGLGRLSDPSTKFNYRTQQPIQVKGDVYLDNEKVGEVVMESESADAAMDRKVHGYQTGNY